VSSQLQFDEATHVYSVRGAVKPSVTKIISDLKLAPPYPEDDPKGLKPFGTACHKAAELRMWDRLGDCDSRIQPYIDGLDEKIREMRIRPLKTELRMYHGELDVAGTLDLYCEIYGGELAVIDYKTGTPPPCVELQLAGYADMLVTTMAGEYEAVRHSMIRRFSMQLTPGRALVRECPNRAFDHHAWRAAVTLWKWQNDRRK